MPTIDELIRKNNELRKVRDRILLRLTGSADALREASMSFIVEFMDVNPEVDAEQILAAWESGFHIPVAAKERLAIELRHGMITVGNARTQMYKSLGVALPESGIPYGNLISALAIDFPSLQNTMMNGVRNRLQGMIAIGTDSRVVEKWLRATSETASGASTLATTALAQFDNAHTFQTAREAGLDSFIYLGQTAEREFCQNHLGKTYTRKEIEGMSNGQGLSVMTSGGGYNCRHMWVAVPETKKEEEK